MSRINREVLDNSNVNIQQQSSNLPSEKTVTNEAVPMVHIKEQEQIDELRIKVIQKYNLNPNISDTDLAPFIEQYVNEITGSEVQHHKHDEIESEHHFHGEHLHDETTHKMHDDKVKAVMDEYFADENNELNISVNADEWNKLSKHDQKMFLEDEILIQKLCAKNDITREEYDKLSLKAQGRLRKEYNDDFINKLASEVCGKSVDELTEADKLHAMEHLWNAYDNGEKLPYQVKSLIGSKLGLTVIKEKTFDPVTGKNLHLQPGQDDAFMTLLKNADEKMLEKYQKAVADDNKKLQKKLIAEMLEAQFFEGVDLKDNASIEKLQKELSEFLLTAGDVDQFEMLNKASLRIRGKIKQQMFSEIRTNLDIENKKIAQNAIANEKIEDRETLEVVNEELAKEAQNGNKEPFDTFVTKSVIPQINNEDIVSGQVLTDAMVYSSDNVIKDATKATLKSDRSDKNEIVAKAVDRALINFKIGDDAPSVINAVVDVAENGAEANEIYNSVSKHVDKERMALWTKLHGQRMGERTREDAEFRKNCSKEDMKQLGESYRSVANNMSEKEAIAYLKDISDITSQYHVDYQQVLYELDINSKYTEVQEYAASNIYKLDESIRDWAVDYTKSLNIESVTNSIQSVPPAETSSSSEGSTSQSGLYDDYSYNNPLQTPQIPLSEPAQVVKNNIDDMISGNLSQEALIEVFNKLPYEEQSKLLKAYVAEKGDKVNVKLCDAFPELVPVLVENGKGLDVVARCSMPTGNMAIKMLPDKELKILAISNPHRLSQATYQSLVDDGILKVGNQNHYRAKA